LLAVSDVLACGGVAASLADIAGSLAPSHRVLVRLAVIVGVVGFVTLVNLLGVAWGSRLVTLSTAVKLLPLAVFVAAGLPAIHAGQLAAPAAGGGLGRAILLALFAFVGMEGALSVSGEVANPARNIPRALGLALGLVTALYASIQLICQGILGPVLGASPAPLAEAMGRVHPLLRLLMLAGGALSMLGWIAGDLLASPRIVFAFARDGRLPRSLGRVHARSRVPHVAIMCYALTAIALAISGTFAELAVLSALTSTVIYIGGCLAAGRLAQRGIALAGAPLAFTHLKAAMVTGIAGMLVMIALASRAEVLGLAALLTLCAVGYRLQGRGVAAVRGS
jgi:basic amino acid/polyamine antiporter, APA family